MIWQDIVITSGSIVFAIALIPELRDCYSGGRMNVMSSALTGLILLIFCIVYASLGMWLAAIPLTATEWLLISYLSWRNTHE